jgi:lipocalin
LQPVERIANAREPKLSEARYARLTRRAQAMGFDISKLIMNEW